jgi:hypothetical protein
MLPLDKCLRRIAPAAATVIAAGMRKITTHNYHFT